MYVKDAILYVFVAGSGNVSLKRQEHLSSSSNVPGKIIKLLKLLLAIYKVVIFIFLETQSFAQQITTDTLFSLTDQLPNEMAETLNGRLQNAQDSTISCIIIKVEGQVEQVRVPIQQHYQKGTSATFEGTATTCSNHNQQASAFENSEQDNNTKHLRFSMHRACIYPHFPLNMS